MPLNMLTQNAEIDSLWGEYQNIYNEVRGAYTNSEGDTVFSVTLRGFRQMMVDAIETGLKNRETWARQYITTHGQPLSIAFWSKLDRGESDWNNLGRQARDELRILIASSLDDGVLLPIPMMEAVEQNTDPNAAVYMDGESPATVVILTTQIDAQKWVSGVDRDNSPHIPETSQKSPVTAVSGRKNRPRHNVTLYSDELHAELVQARRDSGMEWTDFLRSMLLAYQTVMEADHESDSL